MLNIITIGALVLSFVLALVLTLLRRQGRGKLLSFYGLDIAFTSLIIYFLLARIAGLLLHADELATVGWSFFPLTQPDEQILLLENWPWMFFNFLDGRFLFLDVGLCFVLAVMLGNLTMSQNLRGYSERFKLERRQFAILVVCLTPLLLATIANGYLAGNLRLGLPFSVVPLLGLTALFIASRPLRNWRALKFLILGVQFLAFVLLTILIEPGQSALNWIPVIWFYALLTAVLFISSLRLIPAPTEQKVRQPMRPRLSSNRFVN